MAYKITYTTGGSYISYANTLVEAKKDAMEHAGYGYGSIFITVGKKEGEGEDFSGDPVAFMLEHDSEWIEAE